MLVTFVSQCEKKALKRTRRILDAFANRIGSNVWQTAITEDGLMTVKRLLRQSATRSTAVSCHQVRTRQRTELLWIVGNKRKFNEVGIVPVNSTKRNILHREWENDWAYLSSIQIIATLAALLHDIGKSTNGFQEKLIKGSTSGDPYRHEWISLKLFSLIIQDCKTDEEWLSRLANLSDWLNDKDIDKKFSTLNPDAPIIGDMPPLAQWLAWLIVTHHRLPPLKEVFLSSSQIERFNTTNLLIDLRGNLHEFYSQLKPIDYWVKNPKSLLAPSDGGMSKKQLQGFWQFNNLVIHSSAWQKTLKRWSKKALNDSTLMQISKQANSSHHNDPTITDPLLIHLSRLCLMIGDHNYSSLKVDDRRCIKVKESFAKLAANTTKTTGHQSDEENKTVIKQSLEEHLIGVAEFTSHFARTLPIIASEMPHLKNHDPLAKPTGVDRFKWQNSAFKLAAKNQQASKDHGFFGVNMASTGAGKTIGNARIMYGLADQKKGARFTIALGLRVLTLQTGLSFRKNLNLQDDQLAILVGGSAHRKLFEMNHNPDTGEATEIAQEADTRYGAQAFGSESSEELVDELVDSSIDYDDYEALNLDTVIANPKARDLLFAPIVTCTVDHLIQASECKRGGKYIAPLLRLLSSDLILDEPDDFDQADLPALTRLTYLAGLMGTRVLLSSATLTPDLVTGLFNAYLSGRHVFNKSQNKPSPKVVCGWFDEQPNSAFATNCANTDEFFSAHNSFSTKRAAYLDKQTIRRHAEILPLNLPKYSNDTQNEFYASLAQTLLHAAITLHQDHAFSYPNTGQNVSIGLVRIANVNNITGISQQFFNPSKISIPEDTIIHVACYHAKQLLLLRNSLENKLDRILDRNNDVRPYDHNEVSDILHQYPVQNHIFMVLATPVAEVGRDHDYDWAIVEPSSMRSIIQLAGRIWRHRPKKVATTTNMFLLQYNIRYFKQSHIKRSIFTRPGFETGSIKPESYDLNNLIAKEQLSHIDARPRIISSVQADNKELKQARSLDELEHLVMKDLMNSNQLNYVSAYYHPLTPANRVHTHLQQISPFRFGSPQQDWLLIPRSLEEVTEGAFLAFEKETEDFSGCDYDAYYHEDILEQGLMYAGKHNKEVIKMKFEFNHPQVKPWLYSDVRDVLHTLQSKQPDKSLRSLAVAYSSVSLERLTTNNSKGWLYHEYFGFIKQ